MEYFGPDPSEISQKHLIDFHRLRRNVFVDAQGWDLLDIEQLEWDQYDVPLARYVVAYEGNKIVGGARIAPTCAQIPIPDGAPYSFMLGDFTKGRINHSLEEITFHGFSENGCDDVWEITRLISTSSSMYKNILSRCASYLEPMGVTGVLSYSDKRTLAALQRYGYDARPVTNDVMFNGKPHCGILTRKYKNIH